MAPTLLSSEGANLKSHLLWIFQQLTDLGKAPAPSDCRHVKPHVRG
ncbi:hypothetical protein KPSA3_07748 [Pseudomonas syringae pv. actinidiae]|uniref:Uncharacterized protein n=1 Tax=Pseudomonas syringae pv. actinidiae TaxID=103796 RepID=A0AAN4QDR4_PSESF|nr:hypothetical protein KPSA3_07748 [Pseudomonas syringae pv. actinidiae]